MTLTQSENIDHSQTNTYNDAYISDLKSLAANLVDMTATSGATSGSFDVGSHVSFGDDGPKSPTLTVARWARR